MYTYPLYRPPSEARSLIIQITEGCSHNKCKFCYMYKEKRFRIKSEDEIKSHIKELKEEYPNPRRIFLADGNVLCLKTSKLIEILNLIKETFPNNTRISSYSGPKDLLNKSESELKEIKKAGLDMLYIGVESGSDEILEFMRKGVNSDQMKDACIKAKDSGFIISCMIISGLGGRALIEEHAMKSALLISKIKPHYLGLLRLTIDENSELVEEIRQGNFQLLTPKEVLFQNKIFIENIDSEGTIFRANHVSNSLNLSGTFNKDKKIMLDEINCYLENNEDIHDFNHGI